MARIITARNLSKLYRLGAPQYSYRMLREAIMDSLFAPWRRRRATAQKITPYDIWALDGVSFDVSPGEVIGIIGRNGAGKSTLLKILSRITEPTRGEADLYGRVGSLLEVGMGFHGELSGRENIYLSAAILGMRRAEIARRFDEIVAFSELERFLDTPVKYYSSGMFMRLAFAVAAHLQPEILIVDEVLAVGDLQFQKKCLGKMEDAAREGRTVLFVSHNMPAVRTLCSRGIFLENGRVVFDGPIADAVIAYTASGADTTADTWRRSAPRNPVFQIDSIAARLQDRRLILAIQARSFVPHKPAFLAIDIQEPSGTVIMQALPLLEGFIKPESSPHQISVEIDLPPLVPGIYRAGTWIGTHNTETLDEVRGAVSFTITESPTPGRTFPHTPDHGFIVPDSRLDW